MMLRIKLKEKREGRTEFPQLFAFLFSLFAPPKALTAILAEMRSTPVHARLGWREMLDYADRIEAALGLDAPPDPTQPPNHQTTKPPNYQTSQRSHVPTVKRNKGTQCPKT